jgi:hypothetical protein
MWVEQVIAVRHGLGCETLREARGCYASRCPGLAEEGRVGSAPTRMLSQAGFFLARQIHAHIIAAWLVAFYARVLSGASSSTG